MRVPALETAPPVDTKGKPASVATHWFFRSWGKIRQSTLLPLICMWLIIIGLVYVLIHNAHILDKMRMALIAKSPVIAEVAVVLPPPPIAVVAVAAPVAPMVSVAPGGKLAIASGGGLAMVDSSITINNTVTTTTQATPPQIEVMPYREPTQLPEPSPTAEFTETRVIIQPGCYQTYVPPRECNLYAYWPEVDHNAIQIYYDGRPGIPYGPILVRQSYGYRNNGSHPVGMTMRVMRQPGGQGWHR
jgi:hypothetical protein